MAVDIISGELFAQMVRNGAENLNRNRVSVNELNVFPIPDGDTGDNMFMTVSAGAEAAKKAEETSLGAASDKIARGMLLGARGNSGVILSRIFAGIAYGLKDCSHADLHAFADAMEYGRREAYRAVSVPTEGTILTVYKDAVNYANSRISDGGSFESYFSDFVQEANASLERTPDLLAVLKEAGVVDSGGAGLLYIAEGMRSALQGEMLSETATDTAKGNLDLSLFDEDSKLEFGYCTEFLLRLQNAKVDVGHFNENALIADLNRMGESVVAFRDGSIVKVHVHTKTPGEILNYCQQYGEFLTLKIENMTLQHSENSQKKAERLKKAPHKKFGTVAVGAGEGIKATFLSLGVDAVVDGGQSNNPSTEDFVRAFEQVNADNILVFPNNGNVILAAQQAADVFVKAKVTVVPSKNIGEGYAAISMLDTSSGDAKAILADLEEIMNGVVTGMVSKASRNLQKDGVEVREGDYIGFSDHRIYSDCENAVDTVVDLAGKLSAGKFDVAILVCGSDTPAEEAQKVYKTLSDTYRRTEFIMIDGGQPIYDYILILE